MKEKIEELQVVAGNESVKFDSIYEDIISLKDLLKKVEVKLNIDDNSINDSGSNLLENI